MTNPREELLRLLATADGQKVSWMDPHTVDFMYGKQADAVLKAGWRPPHRQITTIEERDALPIGTVIRDAVGEIGEITDIEGHKGVCWNTYLGTDHLNSAILPAEVLWEPAPTVLQQPLEAEEQDTQP